MLTSCYYYKVLYKDYVNVYIDWKFEELKLGSVTFLAKMYSKYNPKNSESCIIYHEMISL